MYFGLQILPPAALALGLLSLAGLKLYIDRAHLPARLLVLGGVAILLLAAAALWVPLGAMTAYPIFVSLGFAAVFGHSLWRGPSMVERIARLREPFLPDWVIGYTRIVTMVWFVFFLANATVSAMTALRGDLQIWALYNGLISYVLMGGLFASEFAVRSYLRRRQRVVP